MTRARHVVFLQIPSLHPTHHLFRIRVIDPCVSMKLCERVPVWDASMCGRNRPPGQDSEGRKPVFCHARPAGRQEDMPLS